MYEYVHIYSYSYENVHTYSYSYEYVHTCSYICPYSLVDWSSHWLWFVDTVLWFCPSLSNETLKWLSPLPVLMQESFWWWRCIDRYIISLSPHLHTPFLPISPSLISLVVSVGGKHHVYLLIASYRKTWRWKRNSPQNLSKLTRIKGSNQQVGWGLTGNDLICFLSLPSCLRMPSFVCRPLTWRKVRSWLPVFGGSVIVWDDGFGF